MEQDNINRADRILKSLDGLQKAGAPDFFYTRLSGKMQQLEPEPRRSFLLRPVFVTAVLSVVLVLNVILLTQMNDQSGSKATVQPTSPATIESFAKAYDMNTESLYE